MQSAKEFLENKVDEWFSIAQEVIGITSGDIEPLMESKLEERTKNLAMIMNEIIAQQFLNSEEK